MERIDHVTFITEDIATTAEWFMSHHGLDSVPAHEFHGPGLRSAAIPLADDSYIEILEVADRARAMATVEGRAFFQRIESGSRLSSWAVRTDDIDAIAARLNREPVAGFHSIADGAEIPWRILGIEVMIADPSLPCFIEWPHTERLPGRRKPHHRVVPQGIAWIEITSEDRRLRDWLGDTTLPVRSTPGDPPAVTAVALTTDSGEIVIR